MSVSASAQRKRGEPSSARENRKAIANYKMYINGRWVESESADIIQVVNPSTEQVIATVPKATRDEAKHALESAERAQHKWECLSPLERATFLVKIAEPHGR